MIYMLLDTYQTLHVFNNYWSGFQQHVLILVHHKVVLGQSNGVIVTTKLQGMDKYICSIVWTYHEDAKNNIFVLYLVQTKHNFSMLFSKQIIILDNGKQML